MSWQATGWAFKAPIANPGMKFVLVALAERATSEDDDPEFWTCFPSIETIAKYTAQGYRTIQRHLDALEADGWITRERRTISKGKKGSYDFKLWRLGPLRDNLAGGQKERDPPANPDAEPVENGRTEPVTEPANRTEEGLTSLVAGGDRSEARQAFDLFNELAGEIIDGAEGLGEKSLASRATKLTDGRRRGLNARLREVGGLAGWVEALARVKASPFLTGSTRHRFGLTLDFLLQPSSFTKLCEGFYDRERQPASASPRDAARRDTIVQGFGHGAEELRRRLGGGA